MPRYAYFVILGLVVLGVLLWQSESVQDVSRDTVSSNTADSPESEPEAERPLTPEERSAYIEIVNRVLRERILVYKGRLRISDDLPENLAFGFEYVPIPLISVRCDLFGVQIRGPGGEGDEVNPASMTLIGLGMGLGMGLDPALQMTVIKSSDRLELLDEVCRMVIDELDRLSSKQHPEVQ